MDQRVKIDEAFPEAAKAMMGLSMAVSKTDLTPIQKQLIKVRASQINGCGYCLDMHTKESLKIGETQQRIFVLNAWRDTDLFTADEKALLALTEEITRISQKGVTNETYKRAAEFFSSETIAQIIMTTVLINSWNRMAVSTKMPIPR
jgi:AhpD family alkylhydroperoxidase